MPSFLSIDDRIAIEDLIASYCLFADERRFDDIAALLSEAEVFVGDRCVAGRDAAAVRAMFANAEWPPGASRRHMTTNILVTTHEADLAASVSYFLWLETRPGEAPRALGCGVYRDRFERRAGAWRFTERRIQMDGAGN